MEAGALDSWQGLAALAISIGFSTIRLAVAFLVVPLFSNEIMPALVRNSVFAALGFVVALAHPVDALLDASLGYLLLVVAKEIFLGLCLGFVFGVFLWAFEAAGEIIDTQVGSAQAQIFDPLSGHEVTLFGEFLGRLVNVLFLTVGGLMLLVGLTLKSFAVWPVAAALPSLESAGAMLLAASFSDVFTLIVLVSAPILTVLFLIDLGMGMINRFAQRLNVFFLSNSIKSIVAVLLTLLMLPMILDTLRRTLEANAAETTAIVRALFGG